jgi:hypothetical protein
MSCDNSRFNYQNIVPYGKYSTTLLEELTSWVVDFVILGFLAVFSRHIARPPRQRRKASLQTSRPLDDEGNVGQSRAAEPGTQLKPLLERLPILVVGGVFNGDGVVTLADFVALLRFALSLLRYIFKSWGEADRRYTWRRCPADNNSCECDYAKQISTQRQKS